MNPDGSPSLVEDLPIQQPDEGVDHFVALALKYNPAVRVTVQASWAAYDGDNTKFPKTAKAIEHRLRRALAPKLQAAAEDLRRGDIRELLDSIADQGFERAVEIGGEPGCQRFVHRL